MTVIAIDPGPTQSAMLRWLSFPNGEAGRIESKEILPNDIVRSTLAFISEEQVDVVGIEMIACMGMPVGREVMETILFIGRLMERSPIEPRLIYRREIKMHHCNSMKAKDSNIRQALIDKYGAPGTKKAPGVTYGLKSHLWSAFALATFISENNKERPNGKYPNEN